METRFSDYTTHPTTDNRNSANFVINEFCELRCNGVLGSSHEVLASGIISVVDRVTTRLRSF
jgi:hypothetical protein